MQPTVPSRSVSVVFKSAQKRAPSDDQRTDQGLVAVQEDVSMRALVTRVVALMSALATLVALALAGGAGVQGW